MSDIDTLNRFMVGLQGRDVVTLRALPSRFSPDDAMNLAAWLVSMAEMDATHSFADVLAAVQNT